MSAFESVQGSIFVMYLHYDLESWMMDYYVKYLLVYM